MQSTTQSLGLGDGKNEPKDLKNTSKENSSKMIVKQIEGTPFVSVEKKPGAYVVVFGQHMIANDEFKSHAEAATWVSNLNLSVILNVVGIFIEHQLKELQISNQIKN